jgi:release factor glutamine methyltransferase
MSETRHTVGSILAVSEDWLAARGVDQAKVDAGVLLAHALGLKRLDLYLQTDRPLSETELALFRPLLQRRGRREPVNRILGLKGFWQHEFEVTPDVLCPRADSELLVETALGLDLPPQARVIDLCTGSGCLAVSLAAERSDWQMLASDCSEAALVVAARNLKRCGVEERIALLCGDLFAGAEGPFDLIVSNPPYIGEDERAGLDPEVRDHDPHVALFSGLDGLDLMRRLVTEAPKYLAKDGWLLVEHGHAQGADVRRLFENAGLSEAHSLRDLGSRERATLGRLTSID